MSQIRILCDNVCFHIYGLVKEIEQSKILCESKYGSVGQYDYRIDSPHDDTHGQKHIHVMKKGKDLLAINQDGTAHDGFHNVEIPKKIYDALPGIFPGIDLPQNRLIECVITKPQTDEEVAIWGEYIEECTQG
jgi:hypothetical protein